MQASTYDFIDEAHNNTSVRVSEALAQDLAQFDTDDGNEMLHQIWSAFSFWVEHMPAMDAAFIGGFSGLDRNVQVDMRAEYPETGSMLIEYEPHYEVAVQVNDQEEWIPGAWTLDEAITLAKRLQVLFDDAMTADVVHPKRLTAEVYKSFDSGEFEHVIH